MSFPLDHRAVHLCIDMQRLFAEASPWHVPWMPRILPQIMLLAERCPARTIFTRFIPPATRKTRRAHGVIITASGSGVTREHLDSRLLDLIPPLAALVPPHAS